MTLHALAAAGGCSTVALVTAHGKRWMDGGGGGAIAYMIVAMARGRTCIEKRRSRSVLSARSTREDLQHGRTDTLTLTFTHAVFKSMSHRT